MMKKYIAEFVGTFSLAAVVLSLAGQDAVATPFMAAITLMIAVYTIGRISGCHINPAVTVGAWSIGKISLADGVGYIASQFLGAWAALQTIAYIGIAGIAVPDSVGTTGMAEALGMFFFTFGVAAVVFGHVKDCMSGVVVGGSLLLGIMIASNGSLGILNPAIAMSLGALNAMYLLGPIAGAILGMQAYRYLAGAQKE